MSNRQVAIISRGGIRAFHVHKWETWKHPTRGIKVGRFKRWGIVKEFFENDKILADFDAPEIPTPVLFSLAHTLGLTVKWWRYDRTRKGWHLIVKLRQRLTPGELIAASLILGSDTARARLDLCRAISVRLHPSKFWERRISLLFERKVKPNGGKELSGNTVRHRVRK